MKLRVNETVYEISDIQGSTLGNLMELKVKTKRPDFPGVTAKSIKDTFAEVGEKFTEPDFDPVELLGDEAFLHSLVGLVFLTKRLAGETVSVDDVWGTPFDDVQFIPDEEEEAEVESPKESEGAADAELP